MLRSCVPAVMSKSGHLFKSIWQKALAQPKGALTFVVCFSLIYLCTASFSRGGGDGSVMHADGIGTCVFPLSTVACAVQSRLGAWAAQKSTPSSH